MPPSVRYSYTSSELRRIFVGRSGAGRVDSQAPQVPEGVDARRVPALEGDLQGVLTHQHDIRQVQLGLRQSRSLVETTWRAGFPSALGARAGPAEAVAAQ